MSIEARISQALSQFTNNQLVSIVKGNTIGECLSHLVKQFPALKSALFDKSDQLHRYINIYVNEESTSPENLDEPVNNDDRLYIMMVFPGG